MIYGGSEYGLPEYGGVLVVDAAPTGVTEDQRSGIGTIYDLEGSLLYSNIGGGELSGC